MKAQRERRYNSYSVTTSSLDGVSGQRHAPAALYPRKKGPQVSIGQESSFAQEPVWTQRIEGKNPFASAGDLTSVARLSNRRIAGWV
jgi:hypothetical protein